MSLTYTRVFDESGNDLGLVRIFDVEPTVGYMITRYCTEGHIPWEITSIEENLAEMEIVEQIVLSLINKMNDVKNSILKQAFEGKLVPQDPNDEPAEILLEKIKKQMPAKTRGKKNGT